jgi:hypothetical protein
MAAPGLREDPRAPAKRVANVAALRGRDVLRQALGRLGFELR